MPNLQYLADVFYKDDEIQYVYNESQKTATKEPIKVTGEYIYTKLKEYPYEFQIDGKLRLASIDGVKVAESTDSNLEERLKNLETIVGSLQTENQELKNKVSTLENETIVNKRIKLTADDFTPLEINVPEKQEDKYFGSILLKESVKLYKYLEIQIEVKNASSEYWGNRTELVALDSLKYNNSNTSNFEKDTSFTLVSDWAYAITVAVQCHLKSDKEIVITSGATTDAIDGILRIKEVYGIK